MIIDAKELDYKQLNEALRSTDADCTITNCLGQRFIASGMSDKKITISGVPGNALGAYLNGAEIEVAENAQDAVGDTMNDGTITIYGNVGDAVGYAMRGGKILIKGNAGYRAGIHMKAYKEKHPTMIIGGRCGSFLGEYQAGGTILVLGIRIGDKRIVGNYPSTGMHGGKVYIRSDCKGIRFPKQVTARPAEGDEIEEIRTLTEEYCTIFGYNAEELLESPFTVVVPDSKNPYKQMYVAN